MKSLQKKLAVRRQDIGEIDGILGFGTRAAVRAEQKRLGMPADAWPTKSLLSKLWTPPAKTGREAKPAEVQD